MKTFALAIMITTVSLAFAQDVERGYMGVTLAHFSEIPDKQPNYKIGATGLYINDVYPDSPAALAGLEKGDRLVSINESAIGDNEALKKAMSDMRAGDVIDVTIERNGELQVASLTLGTRKEAMIRTNQGGKWAVMVKDQQKPYIGIQPKVLGDQLADYFGVTGGVLIEEVMDETPALLAGLQAGDVIVAANGVDIADMGDLSDSMDGLQKGDLLELRVQRRDEQIIIPVTLDVRKAYIYKRSDQENMEHRERMLYEMKRQLEKQRDQKRGQRD